MSEEMNEKRSWRPREDDGAAAASPLQELMRELQRRRELARTYRSLTRDYLRR
jgi:hypothetical protein